MKTLPTISAYIASYPKDVQTLLKQMRQTVAKAAPQAEEGISYGMPVFKLNGNLVYFGAFKKHIGFFPTSSGISAFKKELAPYVHAKGSVQFPYSEPLPLALVTKVVKFRVQENVSKKKK